MTVSRRQVSLSPAAVPENQGKTGKTRSNTRADSARTPGTPPARSARAPRGRRASPFFSQRLVEDRLVQAQIGHQARELAILIPQLPPLAQFTEAQGSEALLPPEERLLA